MPDRACRRALFCMRLQVVRLLFGIATRHAGDCISTSSRRGLQTCFARRWNHQSMQELLPGEARIRALPSLRLSGVRLLPSTDFFKSSRSCRQCQPASQHGQGVHSCGRQRLALRGVLQVVQAGAVCWLRLSVVTAARQDCVDQSLESRTTVGARTAACADAKTAGACSTLRMRRLLISQGLSLPCGSPTNCP